MLLPIPYGTESTLRRLPSATIVIVVLNVLAFFATRGSDTRAIEQQEAQLERLAGYELEKGAKTERELAARLEAYPTALAFLAGEPDWPRFFEAAEDRVLLQGYLADYQQLTKQHPFYRYGSIPAEFSLKRLVTSMFLHADVLHLCFNMLFLWVVGCVLEDRWGVPLYVALYLVLGGAAALADAVSRANSVEPAIGASGAIAGLMGAFAVQHGRSRIRIYLVYGLGLVPRGKPVSIPAAVFLGLWFLQQLFWGLLTVKIQVGVAFWAHLGGFAAGVLAALALRLLSRGDLAERLREV